MATKKEKEWTFADYQAFYRSTRHSLHKQDFAKHARKANKPVAQQSDSTPKPLVRSDVKKRRAFGVFLIFEFGKDDELRDNFYSQAEQSSRYEIIDYSLKVQYSPDLIWLERTRKQINLSDIVIVVIGQGTHNAPGVKKGVAAVHRLKKPIFQVRQLHQTAKKVYGAGEVIPWKWREIDAKIAEKLLK